jgi:ferrous iron transport protein B
MKKITVALSGNPNSGKTTIFNLLTGARQHVGNYPGVTVEKKEGLCKYDGYEITFVDLPGTYSLTAYSIEEIVTRNFIIEKQPDVVVDIVDASNIERNLYLATQLIEINVPLILAFNMSDVAEQKGLLFDIEQLSRLLESPIVPMIGNKGKKSCSKRLWKQQRRAGAGALITSVTAKKSSTSWQKSNQ